MPKLAEELLNRVKLPPTSPDAAKWNAFRATLTETGDLERALHLVELPASLLALVVQETWGLISEAEAPIWASVLADPNHLPLTRLFRHLLRTAQASLSIVTTNYDRLAEYAANAAEAAFFTGFTPGLFGRFLTDLAFSRCSLKCPGTQGHVFLWKVHGSLDWFETPTKEPLAIQGTWGVPPGFRPLIVTPGLAKYRLTHADPFRTVMAKADATLEHARAYLCIGYGFNDEHIQPKLLSRLSRADVPIIVVTKALTQAGRDVLLVKPGKKFLILEEATGGTRVYHPDAPAGEVLTGCQLWALPHFLDMVLGTTDTKGAI